MQDAAGQPVDYSNGGYIQAVEPALGDPGYLELNHFYLANFQTQIWRVPTASNHPIKDATVTFELADGYDALSEYVVSFDPVSSNASMANWGGYYDDYTWSARGADAATQNADGSWTVSLGDLPTMGGTVYQFNVRNADGSAFTHTDRFIAEATLTGSYFQGTGCALPPIENPAPTPDIGECQVEYLGTTIWTKTDRDITDRIKVHDGEISDAKGEVNADGWGAGSDQWGEGATRTFRLYGGTHTELTNVQYEVQAVRGFNFDSSTVSALSTPGGGALQGNGLTEAIEGAGAIEFVDERTIRMSVDTMPAHSSFSFNVTGVLDATTNAMVLHHRLIGDDPNCEPVIPTDPEEPPVSPEEPPVSPEEPPVSPEEPPVSPEEPPVSPEEPPVSPEEPPVSPEEPPVSPEEPPVSPEEPPVSPEEPPVSPEEPPVSPEEPPVSPEEPPVSPEEPPVSPEEPPVSPEEPPVDAATPATPQSPSEVGDGAGEASDELAVTGSELSGFVAVFGALLLAVGVALSVRARRS
ncbi:hypothetical protein [Microbacterium sp. A94]|uniref:hypothetical protein n=1 Tax=Microbacterium sp. A94 TaxID=3450717 RepID=UPI003F42C64D